MNLPTGLAGPADVPHPAGRPDVVADRHPGAGGRLPVPGGSARPRPPLGHPATARLDRRVRTAPGLPADPAARGPSGGVGRRRDRHRTRPVRVLRRPGWWERQRVQRPVGDHHRLVRGALWPDAHLRSSGPSRKAAVYGTVAGVLFGLSSSLAIPTLDYLHESVGTMLAHWECYALAVAGVSGFVVQQVSLGTGRLAPSVATVSVANPVVGDPHRGRAAGRAPQPAGMAHRRRRHWAGPDVRGGGRHGPRP